MTDKAQQRQKCQTVSREATSKGPSALQHLKCTVTLEMSGSKEGIRMTHGAGGETEIRRGQLFFPQNMNA